MLPSMAILFTPPRLRLAGVAMETAGRYPKRSSPLRKKRQRRKAKKARERTSPATPDAAALVSPRRRSNLAREEGVGVGVVDRGCATSDVTRKPRSFNRFFGFGLQGPERVRKRCGGKAKARQLESASSRVKETRPPSRRCRLPKRKGS